MYATQRKLLKKPDNNKPPSKSFEVLSFKGVVLERRKERGKSQSERSCSSQLEKEVQGARGVYSTEKGASTVSAGVWGDGGSLLGESGSIGGLKGERGESSAGEEGGLVSSRFFLLLRTTG